MIPKTLSLLRLRASGSLRWICCLVLFILILLRVLGPFGNVSSPAFQESALKTEARVDELKN